ncbi:MAG: hypothetical protein Q8O87_02670, partial [bacterium]|nr:hypothetical protein [bacterium]
MKNTIGSRNNINWSFLTGLAKIGLTIVISFLAVYGLVQAGSLTPLSDPASTMYTLDDIYNRLDTNATANEGDHNFSISGSPTGSMRTLTEIYEAIPTILADTVKLGTSYLGVDGSLIPNGGTATEADLFTGASAHLNGDWDLDTGTLTLACDTTTFDGAANLVPDSYDGDGDGANRWCIDNSSTATAADIRVGTTAWVNGVAVNGQLNPDVDLTSMYGGGGLGYGGESQDDGGIDDYVGGTGVAEGRYEGNWLTCDSENNWCNTGLE